MSFYGITDIGLVRPENQDSCNALKICDNIHLYIVCDGMGGENGGKTASTIACRTFCESLTRIIGKYLILNRLPAKHKKNIPEYLTSALDEANSAVYNAARSDGSLHGMGTTLVAALVTDSAAYVINVGDSRAYLVYDNRIIQITKDHSYVQFLIDSGKIKPEEAKNHPQKNMITRSVGVESEVHGDIFKVALQNGQFILLCTDGLSNAVSDSDICGCLMKNIPIKDKASALIDLAKLNGSSDNITTLIVKYEK